jgi:pyruvate/2-oxoglutarate dehydrogenase complex dihydrolipoamide dehydrogenase (E3) component
MQSRKRALVEDFASYRRDQLASGRFSFFRGKARFLDSHTLEVTQTETAQVIHLRARTSLIATGSRIEIAHFEGLAETACLDSDTMLSSESIPSSIVVLGGGAIALEAATFYSGLGSKVTLLQRSNQVLTDMDQDVSDAVQSGLAKQGVQIQTNVHLQRFETEGQLKHVHFEQLGHSQSVAAQEILYALGRRPMLEGLGIEEAGVDLLDGRCSVKTTQQTSQPHIFAAGDVCGPHEVVHIAIQQGELAARNAHSLLRNPETSLEHIDYRLKLFAVFSNPGVATVGLSEKEAAKLKIPTRSASYPFGDHGKSMLEGHTDGFVKLTVHEESREILGGAVVGPEASELIHEIVVAMAFRATAGALAQIPHYHPTLSEIWTYPAEELA